MVGRALALRGVPPCLAARVAQASLSGARATRAAPRLLATVLGVLLLLAPGVATPAAAPGTGQSMAGHAAPATDPGEDHVVARPGQHPAQPALGGLLAVVPAPAPAVVAVAAGLVPAIPEAATDPADRPQYPARAPPHPAF